MLTKVLSMTGYIDESTMQAVLQAFTMMTNGFLSQDDAVIALDYCLHKSADHRVTFGEALAELGWNAMLPLQMQGAQSVDISQVRLAAMQAPGAVASGAGGFAQSFAESTLGALAELENAAAQSSDDSNGADSYAFDEGVSLGGPSPLDELQFGLC